MPVGFPEVDQGSASGPHCSACMRVGCSPPGTDALTDAADRVRIGETVSPGTAAAVYTARLELVERVHDELADVAAPAARGVSRGRCPSRPRRDGRVGRLLQLDQRVLEERQQSLQARHAAPAPVRPNSMLSA